MVITRRFVRRYGALIRRMRERGAKVILNGVGPVEYSRDEACEVASFWHEYGLYGLISRDNYTFETYGDVAEHAYNGIDCGFFLNDAFIPVKLDGEIFNVLTFDGMPEPDGLVSGEVVVRPHHKLYPTLGKITPRDLRRENSFVSEQASDFLNIYGNAKAVYSDRVHACVAAAAFGKPFRLYSDSKRALLFERLGVSHSDLQRRLVAVDMDKLQEEKDNHVRFLKGIMTSDNG